MSDIVSPDVRSRMMAGIQGKNTRPEKIIRKGLHKLGFRYRLHDRRLPGTPDMVFPRYRAVIFVHGCFWHAHECHLFKWPSTREDFWRNKILGNREIDAINKELLLQSGWRTGIVWECAIKGKYRLDTEELIGICAQWLTSDIESTEIGGQY